VTKHCAVVVETETVKGFHLKRLQENYDTRMYRRRPPATPHCPTSAITDNRAAMFHDAPPSTTVPPHHHEGNMP
jgi:hypothetical protein